MTLVEQKNSKPKIEETIPEYMEGSVQNTALGFVAYMRANKMTPAWSAYNSWTANYKGKKICTIRLPSGQFPFKYWAVVPHISRWNKLVSSYDLYEEQIVNDGMRDVVWNNVNTCRSCANCGPGWDMKFLGREFENVCHNVPVWYCDPGEVEIDFIKKILAFMKQTIADHKV